MKNTIIQGHISMTETPLSSLPSSLVQLVQELKSFQCPTWKNEKENKKKKFYIKWRKYHVNNHVNSAHNELVPIGRTKAITLPYLLNLRGS